MGKKTKEGQISTRALTTVLKQDVTINPLVTQFIWEAPQNGSQFFTFNNGLSGIVQKFTNKHSDNAKRD